MAKIRKNLTDSALPLKNWERLVVQSKEISFCCSKAQAFSPQLPILKNLHIFRRDENNAGKITNIHGHYILWICLSGSGSLLVDGSVYKFCAQESMLVLPGQPHMRLPQIKKTPINWLLIRFDSEDHDFFAPYRYARFRFDENAANVLSYLVTAYFQRDKDIPASVAYGANLLLLLSMLFRHQICAPLNKQLEFREQGGGAHYVSELCKLILVKSSGEQEAFRQVAVRWHVTPEYLRGVFRKYTGKTPRDFIHEKKIALAQHLLVTSELSVTEIAEHCGFSGIYPFSRFFSQQLGLSPSAFRRRNRGKNEPEK